ncbi:MAG: head GIN domain-containing protein [Bacteroidota bacterium]
MKVSHFLFSFLLTFCIQGLSAKNPSLDKTKRAYKVKDFHSIELNGSYQVVLTQEDFKEVLIEAPEQVHDAIEVKVQRGVLVFRLDTKNAIFKKTKIYISNSEFRSIHIKGAAHVWSKTGVRGEYLDLLTSGAGELDLEVEVDDLVAEIHGAGSIKLRGEAETSKMNIDGAGGIKAFALEVDDLEVELNGAGTAQVYARDDLEVEIRGIGQVTYEGEPDIHKEITGLGRLKRR